MADVQEDPVPDRPAAPDSVPGTVYELGPHRLLCGDSTSADAVKTALGGATADILWTDAPYGVAYQSHMAEGGTASRFRSIENDDLEPEALQAFLTACFTNAAASLRPGAAFYACHANQRPGIYPAFEAALLVSGFHIGSVLVWVKPAATMGWQNYRNRYEPILYGWKKGADRRKVEDRTETTVWEVARDAAISYEHPTQKPVELVEAAALRKQHRRRRGGAGLVRGIGQHPDRRCSSGPQGCSGREGPRLLRRHPPPLGAVPGQGERP